MIVDFFETFRPITEEMVLGIESGRYLVSTHGRIWSNPLNRFINIRADSDGYHVATVQLLDHSQKTVKVHRMVAMAFLPHPNMHNLQVNHKNGIKTCNYPDNLEWCTCQENIDHSIRTGLKNVSGENSVRATISNDTARAICELLQQGVRCWDIIDILNLPKTEAQYSQLNHIKHGESWACISKDYNFDNYPSSRVLEDSMVHDICACFQTYGRETSYIDVLKYIGKYEWFLSLSDEMRYSIKNGISRIRTRRCHTDISDNYIF